MKNFYNALKSTSGWTFFVLPLTAIVMVIVTLSFHDVIVELCRKSGLSHTAAYFSPYVVLLICGLMLTAITRKIQVKWLRIVVAFFIYVLPFTIGFALNPIYEDAIHIGGRNHPYHQDALAADRQLSIIVIPDCPFCKMAVLKSEELRDAKTGLTVEIVLCSADSTAASKYLNLIPPDIHFRLSANPDSLSALVGGSFPAYCARNSDKSNSITIWSNNEFGPRAMDVITSP
jgi:hypothetical protein